MQLLCQVDRNHDFTGGGSGGDQCLPETQTGVPSVASTKRGPVLMVNVNTADQDFCPI